MRKDDEAFEVGNGWRDVGDWPPSEAGSTVAVCPVGHRIYN